jgi:hypothetical protein
MADRRFALCAMLFVCLAAWRGRDGERPSEIRSRSSVIAQQLKSDQHITVKPPPLLIFDNSKERDKWDEQFERNRLLDSMTVIMDPEPSSPRNQP